MKKALEKRYYLWLIIAAFSLIFSWLLYSYLYATDEREELHHFEEETKDLYTDQLRFSDYLEPLIAEKNLAKLWDNEVIRESQFNVNVYRNDSLVYWNNNSVPFSPRTIRKLSSDTTLATKLSNGFYLVESRIIHDLNVIISAKLKNEFFYKNQDLSNDLTYHFHHAHDIDLSEDSKDSYHPISINAEEPLFYVKVRSQRMISEWQQLLIYALYVLGIVAFIMAFAYLLIQFTERFKVLIVIFPLFLLIIRYLSVEYNWMKLFDDFVVFNPNLFATSKLFPSFGSLILTISVVYVIVWWVVLHIRVLENIRFSPIWLTFGYLALFPFSYFVSDLFESLVLNSSISLVIDEVFSLSIYSVICLLVIAGLFLSYFVLANRVIKMIVSGKVPLTTAAVIWFVSGIVYFFIEIFFFQKNVYNALWPVLLNALLFYIHSKRLNINQLKYQVLVLIVVSFYGAFILFENNEVNEHQKRDLYANQLITDQDPSMEIEYLSTINTIKQDPSFKSLLDNANVMSNQEFAMEIEQCCFGTYWERYEMQYFLFDDSGESFIQTMRSESTGKDQLNRIIKQHAQPSSIVEDLYYVNDYYDRLSYIAKEKLNINDSTSLTFFITFRSKKIPEQIGFPRLLMNEKSYALEDLEGYSIARYSNGDLIMHFGGYNYPVNLTSLDDQIGVSAGFRTIDDVSHYVYKQGDDQVVVISKPEKRWVEKLTTFSYLFLFFGLFVLVIIIAGRMDISSIQRLALSTKIQIVLVSIVAVSFLIFAIVAGNNVKKQYNTYTFDNLKEKVQSVETEVSHKLEDKDSLDPVILGDYMNYILKKFSDVFVTDINLYSTTGELLATSQPKLYETGISAEQMNPSAFQEMEVHQRSQYIHTEVIGKLNYLSAYAPFRNKEGRLLGYLNLQHFAKQNAFENQLNEFIVAIINIAVLLLVITVVIAIFVAGWITTPLRLIQESFKKVELGKSNQPIDYRGDDEIGALVKDYNAKLAELELKAMQLARSERETAWREMAKQVAHEIKNPLTPMKLSLQHFQRAFSPDDPKAEEKIRKISNSLVEQIDALTKIANEFSNFAKMPKANEEAMNLLPVLQNVIDLYASKEVVISLESQVQEADVFADKDLLIRVFNNLIKNAIQATREGENTVIEISIAKEKSNYLIRIADRGVGIPKDLQKKIFVPNFTTKSTGAGLGLAMVKQIIHNHNGEIWFDSTVGKGTTFYILLPVHNLNE